MITQTQITDFYYEQLFRSLNVDFDEDASDFEEFLGIHREFANLETFARFGFHSQVLPVIIDNEKEEQFRKLLLECFE